MLKSPIEVCHSCFYSPWEAVKSLGENDFKTNATALEIFASYLTILAELAVGITYRIASGINWLFEKFSKNTGTPQINSVAQSTFKDSTNAKKNDNNSTSSLITTNQVNRAGPTLTNNEQGIFLDIPKFITEALNSPDYTAEEKKEVIAPMVSQRYTSTDFLGDDISMGYLNSLSLKHPNVRTIPGKSDQFNLDSDEQIRESLDHIINSLPDSLPMKEEPYLYVHILGSFRHRVGFVIDLQNKTVEFYESLIGNSRGDEFLKELTVRLTTKYKTQLGKDNCFEYIFVTQEHVKPTTENTPVKREVKLQTTPYACAVWCCKLIEARITNKNYIECSNYIRKNYVGGYDMGVHRPEVYQKSLEFAFYKGIGDRRIAAKLIEKLNVPESEKFKFKAELLDKLKDIKYYPYDVGICKDKSKALTPELIDLGNSILSKPDPRYSHY